jgi:putative hemolysin
VRSLFGLVGTPAEAFNLSTLVRPASNTATGDVRVLNGLTRLSDLEELAGVQLATPPRDVDMLGGLVMHKLGRMPNLGDEVGHSGWLIRVEELDGRRAARLRIMPVGTAPTRQDTT